MSNTRVSFEPIKILHMYHDLMNLYGDYGNVAVLSRELERQGSEVQVTHMSLGDVVDLCKYDMLYIGSGTELSQRACMDDLDRFCGQLTEFVDSGGAALLTGNAHELLGKAVTSADGRRYEALGLFDFETIQDGGRVTGDCICGCSFTDQKIIGFINRSGGQSGEVTRPFDVEFGPGADLREGDRREGVMEKNILGTYLTGPILARNPCLLRHFGQLLCLSKNPGHEYRDTISPNQTAAYESALAQLSKRMNEEKG